MLIEKDLHITLKGNTEDDIALALDEALIGIKCGQMEGFNRNKTSLYKTILYRILFYISRKIRIFK